jgi:hypothetical protein
MRRKAVLVENANAPHVKEGMAMQLEFQKGRYLFLTGYSGLVPGVTEDLVSNLAVIPEYEEAAGDLLKIRDDVERRSAIRLFKDSRMKPGAVFTREELSYISSIIGVDASVLSYIELEDAVSAGLSGLRKGVSGFTDRLVPMWKGKTRCKYSAVPVPVDLWFGETPESLKGFGHYEIRRGKEGGITLSEGKPVDYATFTYVLPGIDTSFADYAGRLKITYV